MPTGQKVGWVGAIAVVVATMLFWGLFLVVWLGVLIGNTLGECFQTQACFDHKAAFDKLRWVYLIGPPAVAALLYGLGLRSIMNRGRAKLPGPPSRDA